jgi:hypothetical protein
MQLCGKTAQQVLTSDSYVSVGHFCQPGANAFAQTAPVSISTSNNANLTHFVQYNIDIHCTIPFINNYYTHNINVCDFFYIVFTTCIPASIDDTSIEPLQRLINHSIIYCCQQLAHLAWFPQFFSFACPVHLPAIQMDVRQTGDTRTAFGKAACPRINTLMFTGLYKQSGTSCAG